MANFDAALSGRPAIVLRINANVIAQNVNGNFSVIEWSVFLIKTAAATAWNSNPSDWGANVNGQIFGGQFTYDFNNVAVGGAIQLAGGQVNVPHNNDGTKNLYVSTGVNGYDPIGTATAVGTFDLPTIPRATVPNWSPAILVAGEARTINLPRAVSSFTHTVDWFFGSQSGQVGTNLGTSVSWTPALSMLQMIPNAASGVGTMRVTTYNGSTVIGQTNTAFQLNAPASAVPSFTTITHSEATAGVAANIGAYVQTISKLALAITGAAGYQGSTIASYKIEVNAQTINAASGTTPSAISASGTVSIVGTITDTRGRTATKTVTATVLAYTPPLVTSISGQRALSAGTPDDEGTFIRVNIKASVKSLMVGGTEKNALVYKIYSRLRTSTPGTWTLVSTTTNPSVAMDSFAAVGTYAITNAYDVRVEIIDDFNQTAVEFVIATSAIFMHWDAALGVGIGKYRQYGMLDVLGDIYHRDGAQVDPVGIVQMTAASVAPEGWLLCDGAAISRTTYARLFDAISTAFGVGNGSSTFNIPNMKGRTPVGIDTTQTEFAARGQTGGAKTHTLAVTEIPSHAHGPGAGNAVANYITAQTGGVAYSQGPGQGITSSTTGFAGGGVAHNNLQPYVTMHYIIKT